MGSTVEGGFQLTVPNYPEGILIGGVNEPLESIYETSTTQKYHLGTKLEFPDGRVFRYARNGAVALAKALMTSGAALAAEATEEAQSTYYADATVGSEEIDIDVTTGATWVENAYADGFMVVNKVTGIGDVYKIVANQINVSDDTLMRVRLETGLRTALAATSELTFVKSKWGDVIVQPTTAEGSPAGIPLVAVAASSFCWLQTAGYAPCIVDTGDTLVKGGPVGYPASPAVAGACGPIAADTDALWGVAVYIATAAETAIIDLMLD